MTWPITHRALAMLRAVSAGRGELVCSCEPDLYVDGCPVCDQYTAHQLAGAGLIRPAVQAAVGQRVRAVITTAGLVALAEGAAA